MVKPARIAWIAAAAASLLIGVPAAVSLLPSGTDPPAACEIDKGRCTGRLLREGVDVALDITPKPVKAMKNLEFQVVLTQGGVSVTDADASLVLTMPGMSMGANSVALAHRGEGRYLGKGVIVKCPSGGDLWQAELRIRRPSLRETQPQGLHFTFRVR